MDNMANPISSCPLSKPGALNHSAPKIVFLLVTLLYELDIFVMISLVFDYDSLLI